MEDKEVKSLLQDNNFMHMVKMWKAERDALGTAISPELIEWKERTRRKLSDILVSESEADKQLNSLLQN